MDFQVTFVTARRIQYHRIKSNVGGSYFKDVVSRVLNTGKRDRSQRWSKRKREDDAYFRESRKQKREGWLADQGASGNAVKIREGESEWWRRASQPTNQPASQSYLNLFTTTACCRKSFCGWRRRRAREIRKLAPFNRVPCRSQLGNALKRENSGQNATSHSAADFAESSTRINHISRGPEMVQPLFNDQIILDGGSRRSSPLRINRNTHSRIVSILAAADEIRGDPLRSRLTSVRTYNRQDSYWEFVRPSAKFHTINRMESVTAAYNGPWWGCLFRVLSFSQCARDDPVRAMLDLLAVVDQKSTVEGLSWEILIHYELGRRPWELSSLSCAVPMASALMNLTAWLRETPSIYGIARRKTRCSS